MRSDPSQVSGPAPGATAVDRLVRRTSRSLAIVTLALIAALLAGVGVVTAVVALQSADQAVDRTLKLAADSRVASLETQAAQLAESTPEPTESPDDSSPDDSGSGSDNSGSGSGSSGTGSDDDAGPNPTPTATPTPTPTATPSATFGLPDLSGQAPESADTFFLLLDPTGSVISNPQGLALGSLPDQSAATAALTGVDDWRTVSANGVRVRLLTQRVNDPQGVAAGILQSGFVLTLQDQQTAQLLTTILIACLTGLAGAAFVTLLVTQRAMRPIRSAFDAERRFVASASHELRTPAAVVRASAEILQREDLVKPEGQKLVEDIISESDRLGRLVGDMLALASAEAGAISVERQPIELRGFVAELARRAESIAGERGVRIEVFQEGGGAPADQELVVSADPDRMTQLLLIFIDNAIDHSPAGGTVRLFVRPVIEGGRAQVAVGVADQGPGVPREHRSRIFEPFARLQGRRRETGNTGLGLAIARILATRQEASLHVDDAIGGGAVFSVWLPRLLPGSA